MSAQELQARIEEVSADIERQKEVLKKLEKSKSALQRQLNDVCDPVARLPLEISSTILTLCLPSLPRLSALQAPLLFLNVCNAWTVIAVSTPALWAAIHIEFPRAEGFSEFLGNWLKRARNCPLSISLHGTFDEGVATVVRRHAEQLKSLEVYSDDIGDRLPTILATYPSLESLTIGSLPDEDGECSSLSESGILEIVHSAPNLVECTFDGVGVYSTGSILPRLVLPSLHHLRLGRANGSDSISICPPGLISRFSLPALQTLCLSIYANMPEQLEAFLKRSSPPLQTLVVAPHYRLEFPDFASKCLRLVPNLAHLELYEPSKVLALGLFIALSDPSGLLPNLRSFRICYFQQFSDQLYQPLYHALSMRRGQIVCAELVWDPYSPLTLPPHGSIVASLRQLVAEGMKIHIGPKYQNFI
ncbi:hypothetical protein DFH09DRAFT_1372032 [Mycena vulgaris]|nr:hypothetical protein DFH09DRAFT_1372032 [Mycena vulgaris]